MRTTKIITIDGPVASGKSTIARALAEKLGFYYLYTGLLYRALAYVMPVSYTTHDLVKCVANIMYGYTGGAPCIWYKGENITNHLYSTSLDQKASLLSAHQDVRDALLDMQRTIGEKYNIIADGRDCGTVVFPDADVKFFLTADVDTRAQRVFNDQKRLVHAMTLEQIRQEIIERDTRDQTRSVAPLRVATDGIVVDNSIMTKHQTIDFLMHVINKMIKI